MEIGFVFLCIGLYMIRRYLRKKKYHQRVKRWYIRKKTKIQMKYNNFVNQVAQTSLFLALLLPHVLYMISTILLKYLSPSILRYLAVKTILSDIISFYIPLYKTFMLVYKYKTLCAMIEQDETTTKSAVDVTTKGQINEKGEPTSNTGGILSFFRSSRKSKSHVADEYKKGANKMKYNRLTKASSSRSTSKQMNSIIKSHNEEMNAYSNEAADLLKYWIVYALLAAMIQTATLIPILGRILYNANPTNARKAAAVSKWGGGRGRRTSWFDTIKISFEFMMECKLIFFVWLRLLPTSFTALRTSSSSPSKNTHVKDNKTDEQVSNVSSVKSRIKQLEHSKLSSKKSQSYNAAYKKLDNSFSNQPLDIVYNKLAPIATALATTSTNIVNTTAQNSITEHERSINKNELTGTNLQSLIGKGISFCRTLLDAMVWTKAIKESTKHQIITTLHQCTSLLPAAITLLMPSYFTNYGVIYVRLVVPSANSSKAYASFKDFQKQNGTIQKTDKDDDIIYKWLNVSNSMLLYLQYWTIQVVISWLLIKIAPVLAWVPLSTHMTWLLWAYVQMEFRTKRLYDFLKDELVAFGIVGEIGGTDDGNLTKKDTKKDLDVSNTITMQFINKIVQKLPSSVNQSKSSDTDNEVTDDKIHDSEVKKVSSEISNSSSNDVRSSNENDSQVKQVSSEIPKPSRKENEESDDNDRKVKNLSSKTSKFSGGESDDVTEKAEELNSVKDTKTSEDNEYVCISESETVEKQ